jgi:acetolactate synthase-1/2/3 large subunit
LQLQEDLDQFLVDIPKDIQFAKTKYVSFKKEKKIEIKNKNRFNQKDIDQLIELMNKASKPIFYTGGGVVNSWTKSK